MKYLSVHQVVEIHDELIRRFGGLKGLRSKDLLESAVFRMQASFGGVLMYENIFEQTAGLFESLAKNHAFVDGNKRTAFVAAVTFLEINNYRTYFSLEKSEKFILAVVQAKKDFRQIVDFFEKHSKKN